MHGLVSLRLDLDRLGKCWIAWSCTGRSGSLRPDSAKCGNSGCRWSAQQVPLEVATREVIRQRRGPSNSMMQLELQTGAAGFEPAISRLTASRYDTAKPTICCLFGRLRASVPEFRECATAKYIRFYPLLSCHHPSQ